MVSGWASCGLSLMKNDDSIETLKWKDLYPVAISVFWEINFSAISSE